MPGSNYFIWQSQEDIKNILFLFSTHEQINVENIFICFTEQTVSIMHILKEGAYFRTQDRETW